MKRLKKTEYSITKLYFIKHIIKDITHRIIQIRVDGFAPETPHHSLRSGYREGRTLESHVVSWDAILCSVRYDRGRPLHVDCGLSPDVREPWDRGAAVVVACSVGCDCQSEVRGRAHHLFPRKR